MTDARRPDIEWLDGPRSPWGVPVLDVRPVTSKVHSSPREPQSGAVIASFAREDGASFHDLFSSEGRPIGAGLRYRTHGPLTDGILFCPTQVEHKWALYYRDHRILVVRSARRHLHLVADVVPRDGHVNITTLHGSLLDPEEDPDWTVRAFDYLIRSHALDTPYPVPLPDGVERSPAGAAMWCATFFGNLAHFATPHRLHVGAPDRPLHTWLPGDPPPTRTSESGS